MDHDTLFRLAGHVHFRDVAGEVVVLDRDAEEYSALNASASVLFRAVGSSASKSQLISALMSEFPEIDTDEAAGDVDAFLSDLARLGWLASD